MPLLSVGSGVGVGVGSNVGSGANVGVGSGTTISPCTASGAEAGILLPSLSALAFADLAPFTQTITIATMSAAAPISPPESTAMRFRLSISSTFLAARLAPMRVLFTPRLTLRFILFDKRLNMAETAAIASSGINIASILYLIRTYFNQSADIYK